MKKYSLEQLEELTKGFFKSNPEEQECLATSDGNIFFSKHRNAAEMHSRGNGGLTIHTISRSKMSVVPKDENDQVGEKLNAKETIELINAAETIEALDAILKDEERKSVLKAAEVKRTELEKALDASQKGGPETRG